MSQHARNNPEEYAGLDYTEYSKQDAPTMCKYGNEEASKQCDWCAEWLCSFCGYVVEDERACNECYEEIKNCSHSCTSDCRRYGCNCDCGEYHKTT